MDEIQKSENRKERRSSVHQVFGWILDSDEESKTARIDGPHSERNQDPNSEPEFEVNELKDAVEADLESHISPLLAELQNRIDELNQKEQLVYSRLAQVDQERRKVRLWARELERDLEEREQRLLGVEAQLSELNGGDTEKANTDTQIPLIDERIGRQESEPSIRELIQQPFIEQMAAVLKLVEHLVSENTRLSDLASGKIEAVELEALEQKRTDFHEESAARQHELDQQERTLEKRTRFQQSHLEKLRRQIEDAQERFRQELQQARLWIENDRIRNRQVANQLRQFRSALDDREKSLEREQTAIQEYRLETLNEAARQTEVIQKQKESLRIESEVRREELTSLEEIQKQKAVELEIRAERIQNLEAQLQRVYAKNIEMRATVEHAWQHIKDNVDDTEAEKQIEQSQNVVKVDVDSLLEIIDARQSALEVACEKLQSMQVHVEQRIDHQSRLLKEQNGQVQAGLADIQEHLEQLQNEQRDQSETIRTWHKQRLAAEKIIRELLDRLEERSSQ